MDGNKTIGQTIGQRIGKARSKADETQQQLADALGVKREMVTYWENGTRNIKVEQLAAIAKRYGVSVDYLLGFTNEPAAEQKVREMCEETGLHGTAIKSLLEKKKESDFQTVTDIVDLIFTSNNFSFKDIILYMNAYRDSINEIEIRLKEDLLSDIAFFEDRKQPFSVSELIKHINFHIAKNEDTISYRLFKATDDFKRFLDECAASAIADYNSTKESYLADVALIKERALESTNGNEEQTISKEKWSEIIDGIF